MSPNYWAAHGMSTIFLGAGSAKGYGILRPGLKTGLENGILKKLSELGLRFGEPGGTSSTDNDNKKLYLQDHIQVQKS